MYHIYNHATGEDNFFRCEENYRYFLEKYQAYIYPMAETFAYCLMPNHFHFMVRIRSESKLCESFKLSQSLDNDKLPKLLSKQFANLFSCYIQSYNKQYDRQGALFRERFRRKPIEKDTYYSDLIGYIHNNPVHHGFVEGAEDWTWSSYHAFTSNKSTKLEKQEVLDWYGGQTEFIKFHQEYDFNVTSEV
jgi:REP element-mobilizing transposase RayT